MAVEWKTARIEDVAEKVAIGPFGSSIKVETFISKGIPIVSGQHLRGTRLEDNEYNFISVEHAQKLKNANVFRGDVIFTHAGNIGQVAYIPKTSKYERYIISQRQFYMRCDISKVLPGFVTRYFKTAKGQHELLANASAVGVPSIAQPVSYLRTIEIPIPPLHEQEAIIEVFDALDDKIELNRKMNEVLKAIAQTLFKSWFLNFDPVHANASGKNYLGLDAATTKLFPASFQNSPIGPVPKGWKVERFDAHITAERGLSYNGEGLRDDCTGLPMHNLNSIYEGGGYKHEGIKYYAGEYREKHLLKPGDMIVANTEQGFDHLLIGHAAIIPKLYNPTGIYSHHIYRVRPKTSSSFSPHYLVELFNNPRWHYWISGFSNGTTINMLPKDALEMPLLVVPPAELVQKFTVLAAAVHSQVETNLEQSRTLAALRDALLPKLLSGELRVPQAKQSTSKITPLFPEEPAKPVRKTTDEFVEAVAIAHLTRRLFHGTHPLGRKRCNKLSYLAHRRTEDDVTEHYLKKAAGPYSPWAKYQGPEGIALKRGYVKNGKVRDFTGFLPGDNITEIDRYVPNYPICAAIDWVISKFKFKKNDELELLATVDYAALDLLREGKAVSLDGIKDIIATNTEWAPKLKREIFSDANITNALTELRGVFPKTYTT